MKLAAFFLSAAAFAATITSNGTGGGNWVTGATWVGGIAPGNGDSAVIAGTDTVNVTTNVTVGTSPAAAGTAAITINSGGKLVFNTNGVTLTVRGDIKYQQPGSARNVIDVQSVSGGISFDPTQAGDPTTAAYVLAPTASSGANALLSIKGQDYAHPFVIQTLRPNNNEAQAAVTKGGFSTQINRVDMQYFTLLNMGNSSLRAFDADVTSQFVIQDGTSDTSGIIGNSATSIANTGTSILRNVTFKNSPATTNYFTTSTVSITSGTRVIDGNYFDKFPYTGNSLVDWTISNNVYATGINGGGDGLGRGTATASGNLIIHAGSSTFLCNATATGNYFINTAGANNGKFCQTTLNNNASLTNSIFEQNVPGTGDTYVNNTANTTTTMTVRGNIYLPSLTDTFPTAGGTWTSTGNQATTVNWVVENNTGVSGGTNASVGAGSCGNSGPFPSEGVQSNAGSITSYKGNFVWSGSSARGAHGCTQNATLNDNILAPANADYNGYYNCSLITLFPGKTNQGTCYWFPMTGSTPGTNDVNQFANFAANTRTSLTWATYKGITSSYAGIQTYLQGLTGAQRAVQIADLINYVRRGFTPYNVNLANASAPNGKIGAMAPQTYFGTIGALSQ